MVGTSVDQHHVVDPEGLLERGQLVELLEQQFRVDPGLALDQQPHTRLAVRQVRDIGDAGDPVGADQVLQLGDDPLGADQIGQLGDLDSRRGLG